MKEHKFKARYSSELLDKQSFNFDQLQLQLNQEIEEQVANEMFKLQRKIKYENNIRFMIS